MERPTVQLMELLKNLDGAPQESRKALRVASDMEEREEKER
jgi:hypothetical protein